MSSAEILGWIATLPLEYRGQARVKMASAWDDGFLVGSGRLPRRNPFDIQLSEHLEMAAKKKR